MHTINERDERFLRTLTGCHQDDLPADVVTAYWTYKKILNRTQPGPVSLEVLAMIVMLAGHTQRLPADQEVRYARELFVSGELKVGDPVRVVWRKKQVDATFLGLASKTECKVQIGSSEQVVKDEAVTLPQLAAV